MAWRVFDDKWASGSALSARDNGDRYAFAGERTPDGNGRSTQRDRSTGEGGTQRQDWRDWIFATCGARSEREQRSRVRTGEIFAAQHLETSVMVASANGRAESV